MKILYVTTIGGTMNFFIDLIRDLISSSHTVDIATNEDSSRVPNCYHEMGCKVFQISTSRSPFSAGNLRAIIQIKKIAKDYDIIHCHTPLAGMATRIGCRGLRKKGKKVIYTAHGFHFYSGCPLKNWLIYFPIERLCSRWTDTLITINQEDYERAKKVLKAKRIEYVPGVGINTRRFRNASIDKAQKRIELGVPVNARMLLSVGELNENKNHQVVIKAISIINDKDLHYVIAGEGKKENFLKSLAKSLGVQNNVHFLGFRRDVEELYKCADLYVLPSIREGLNVSIMEAMSSGLPCIASNIRGNTDMIPEENCFNPQKVEEVVKLIQFNDVRNSDFVNMIDVENINKFMKELYR
jgi:glycosyltransferase involved in cell wall biosynthesis